MHRPYPAIEHLYPPNTDAAALTEYITEEARAALAAVHLAATDAAAVPPDAPFFQASHEVGDEVEHMPIAAPAENITSSAEFVSYAASCVWKKNTLRPKQSQSVIVYTPAEIKKTNQTMSNQDDVQFFQDKEH